MLRHHVIHTEAAAPARLLARAGLVALLLITMPAVVGAEPAPAAGDSLRAAADAPLALLARPLDELPALARDLRLRLAAGDQALQEAGAALAAARSEPERTVLLRRIGDIKRQTERDLLGIQLDHARQEDRAEDAAQLEAVLAKLAQPEVPVHPAQRSAPARQ